MGLLQKLRKKVEVAVIALCPQCKVIRTL